MRVWLVRCWGRCILELEGKSLSIRLKNANISYMINVCKMFV